MYHEIFKHRDCGLLRICSISSWESQTLNDALSLLGLSPNAEELSMVSAEQCQEIISKALWKDLAYGCELMPLEKAQCYAKRILEDYYNADCTAYTNLTVTPDGVDLSSWSQMTEATFDCGVIIKHNDYCFCLWVEDED